MAKLRGQRKGKERKRKVRKSKQRLAQRLTEVTIGDQVPGADAQLPADELLVVFEVEVLEKRETKLEWKVKRSKSKDLPSDPGGPPQKQAKWWCARPRARGGSWPP